MATARKLWHRLRSLRSQGRLESELDAELGHHLELETEKNVSAGMSPEAARRAARIALGGVEQIKEQTRDAWGAGALEGLRQDVRYGLRSIRQNPGFAAAVVLTLGLGIGANTAIFSIVNGVLLRPLPYGEPERLVVVRQTLTTPATPSLGFSEKELLDYRAASRTLEDLVEYHTMSFTLLGGREAERVQTGVVSRGFFDVLGVPPLLGRTFRARGRRAGRRRGAGAEPRLLEAPPRRRPADRRARVPDEQPAAHGGRRAAERCPSIPNANDVYMSSLGVPVPLERADAREPRRAHVERLRSAQARRHAGAGEGRRRRGRGPAAGGSRRLLPRRLGLHGRGGPARRRAHAARAADPAGAARRRRAACC